MTKTHAIQRLGSTIRKASGMRLRLAVGLLAALQAPLCISAQETAETGYPIEVAAEGIFNAGSGEFAPYYIMSNNHGIVTQSKNALLRLSAERKEETDKRFSYSFGVDFLTGYSSSTDYMHFTSLPGDGSIPVPTGYLTPHSEHPARIWLQQLYGQVRYRGVFLMAGMKEYDSALLNSSLSSGDLVESGNARPIPQVRIGFNDFQNIPFTNGWLQIQGEISYGKMTDNAWMRHHYNYFSSHLNQGALYTYKRCYFRTRPSERFSATFGMQVGAFFGGETEFYRRGMLYSSRKMSRGIKQFFKMFIPTDGGLEYYSGSSLGSWDIHFRYRLDNGHQIKAYLQKPWEDGSGIGFLNGFDGLWGLEYAGNPGSIISGAVVEYLDFTNQSGYIHWDPDDHSGTNITYRAEGNDDYYNNAEYNSYANYGMAIGSPFMTSPIYNTDGCPIFIANRVRGFHVGLEGTIIPGLTYRLLGGYRKAWGSGYIPLPEPRDQRSFMVEATYTPRRCSKLTFKAALGIDHGDLTGNNTGGMITVRFNDILRLGK